MNKMTTGLVTKVRVDLCLPDVNIGFKKCPILGIKTVLVAWRGAVTADGGDSPSHSY